MALVHAVACSCKTHEEKKIRCAKMNLKHFFVFTFRERGFERAGRTALQGVWACKEVNLPPIWEQQGRLLHERGAGNWGGQQGRHGIVSKGSSPTVASREGGSRFSDSTQGQHTARWSVATRHVLGQGRKLSQRSRSRPKVHRCSSRGGPRAKAWA